MIYNISRSKVWCFEICDHQGCILPLVYTVSYCISLIPTEMLVLSLKIDLDDFLNSIDVSFIVRNQ